MSGPGEPGEDMGNTGSLQDRHGLRWTGAVENQLLRLYNKALWGPLAPVIFASTGRLLAYALTLP